MARSRGELDSAEAAICSLGCAARACVLDISDLPALQQLFDRWPAFHIVVNNAGTNRPKPMTEVTEADYDAVLDLNLKSAFFVAQSAVRRMVVQRIAGSLIHIGSQMGHVAGVNRSLYCTSKWGLRA